MENIKFEYIKIEQTESEHTVLIGNSNADKDQNYWSIYSGTEQQCKDFIDNFKRGLKFIGGKE